MSALTEIDCRVFPKDGILVVEDDFALRQMVGATLRKLGYEVLEADSVKDAFRLASIHAHHHLRLLITDIVMPDMDGRDLAHWMRGSYPDLQVLFISGFSHQGLCDHIGSGTGASFLPKPFTQEELSETVCNFLN